MTRTSTPGIAYRVEAANLHAHLYRITLTVHRPAFGQRLMLPVWIPGSYLVREFSRHVQGLHARQRDREIALTQLDKHRWEAACEPGDPLEITCEVYAFDASVRTAWLDPDRGFFNATSLCLMVEGQDHVRHELQVVRPDACDLWKVATGLTPCEVDPDGFGTYQAASYDELADCPVEMGAFWSGMFRLRGVAHRFVVSGAPASFDSGRLLADTRRICEAAIRFWHGKGKPPMSSYTFMLRAVDDGYGGLEHRNSTALICNRRDLPRVGPARQGDGYTTLLGLISHEYFHTWNVKRLRPAELSNYDYAGENYTRLLWFFEGFTSYYDDLLLRRAGLLDNAAYLALLNKTIQQVSNTPGRLVQSVAQASFEAWTKYYRPDENTPNATVSYYAKGALVGLCLDLNLRQTGRTCLDAVMRDLWKRCTAGPMTEADLLSSLQSLTGRSYAQELKDWVHGTTDLPLQDLLPRQGVAMVNEPAAMAQQLGLRVDESGGHVRIKNVLRGGAAERAGMAAGDEWIGIDVPAPVATTRQSWRIHKLDDVALHAGQATRLLVLVARDKRLLTLTLDIARDQTLPRLAIKDPEAIDQWLGDAAS